ncbi:MAG: hypothetical protein QW597_01800 [Thermoplasmataceae archaeon]
MHWEALGVTVVILIAVSLIFYARRRNRKLIGIILLWEGFVDFASINNMMGVKKHVNG